MVEEGEKRDHKKPKLETDLSRGDIETNTETIIDEKEKVVKEEEEISMSALRIRNVPRACKASKLIALAKERGIEIMDCRKPSKNVAFADINSDQKELALKSLNGIEIGGRKIEVFEAEYRKKGLFVPSRSKNEKNCDLDLPEWERLNDKVTPLWRKSYDEQLEVKHKEMSMIVRNQFLKMVSVGQNDKEYQCDPILPSPERDGYRNKCEYSFGRNSQGEVTLGFMLGLYKMGEIGVASPSECLHINETNKKLVKTIETYVKTSSKLSIYDRLSQKGYWRLAIVRTAKYTGETMLIMQTKSNKEHTEERAKFMDYIEQKCPKEALPTTIMWQIHDGVHNGFNEQAELAIMKGTGYITEHLQFIDDATGQMKEYKFRVSPQSFFQSNTSGAEVLYSKIHEFTVPEVNIVDETGDNKDKDNEEKKKIVVLDLCCGTGTIGISMSHLQSIETIVGVELVPEAVEDSKHNAKLNGLECINGDVINGKSSSKLSYVCGRVEKVLDRVLADIDNAANIEIVAVLDPPRAGVHRDVIKAIRTNSRIAKVVYVSCNPKAAAQNWVDLCRAAAVEGDLKKKMKGQPFKLQRALPVDMFPHTGHCEMVLLFSRNSNAQMKEILEK